MRTIDTILTAIPILTVLSFAPTTSARAQAMTLGEASNYALLGLNNGSVTADTAGTVVGDFGYSAGVLSTQNKSVGSAYVGQWTGTAYVHSAVLDFVAHDTYRPTGGIITTLAEDKRLDAANAAALAHSHWAATQSATQTLGALGANITLGSVNGLRTVHVIEVASVNMSGKVLELVGDALDVFVINVRGNLEFSQSEVRLTGGITANHVLFNMPAGGNYTKGVSIHKLSTFRGTILAPGLGERRIELHDRSTLEGAIIAMRVDAHNRFSLTHKPFTATVCLCTGPAATVDANLPSCGTSLDPLLSSTRPVISEVAQIQMTSQFPSSMVFLFASFGESPSFVYPGTTCTIYVNVADMVTMTTAIIDNTGSWSYAIPIPPVCSYVGLPIALQAAILDFAVAGPIPARVSNGVRMTVGL